MNRTLTIFRKELIDTLRDRRTIIMMIVVPMLVIPVLMFVAVRFAERQQRKADTKQINVAVIGAEFAPELDSMISGDSLITVVSGVAIEDVERQIRADRIDGAVVIPSTFLDRVNSDRQSTVQLYFRSSRSLNVTERRLKEIIDDYDDAIVNRRIARRNLDEQLFDAIEIVKVDISTMQEVIGKTVGGFLPYMFILFMFMGSMYPGIDLGAGEKERGTLETLLSSPASRLEIVLGKFLVVGLIGISSAAISMIGLWVAVTQIRDIPAEVMAVAADILSIKVVGTILTLLIPLEAFLASVILAISIHSRSFKEAQSSLTPMSFVVIVPVMFGLMPGVELSWQTALIPILNVSLASKDIISGSINPLHLVLAYASLLALASASLWFCVRWFNKESIIFRS